MVQRKRLNKRPIGRLRGAQFHRPRGLDIVALQVMLVALPWVRLEVYPRITWADVAFAGAFGVFLGRALWTHKVPRPKTWVWGYGFLLLFWVMAVLFSGMNVPHVSPFLFDVAGLLYLSGMSWFLAYRVGNPQTLSRAWNAFLIGLWTCMAFGLVGIILGMQGTWPSWFYSHARKLTATFKYPNQLANFVALFVPWLWGESMRADSTRRRLWYSLGLFLALVEVLATGSRTGTVVALVGLALSVGWSVLQGQRRSWIVGGSLLVGAMLVNWISHSSFRVIRRSLTGISAVFTGQVTDAFRYHNWHLALDLFAQHILKGYGIANIAVDYGYEIHNTYLAVLADMGILGTLAFIFLVLYVTYLAWENVRWARVVPEWRGMAQGLLLGLLGELLFATQHLIYRERHLWVWFAFVVALHAALKRTRMSYVWNHRRLDEEAGRTE